MTTVNILFHAQYPLLAKHTQDLAYSLVEKCQQSGFDPSTANITVSWGGGKDSTLALLIAKGICEITGSNLNAYTMFHPGLTQGVMDNIDRIIEHTQIQHDYWFFTERIEKGNFHSYRMRWFDLYNKLWHTTCGSPRFMCIACNFGAITSEFSALTEYRTNIHITGNPSWEIEYFQSWINQLQQELISTINFHATTHSININYYRFWHDIYTGLLHELWQNNEECFVDNISLYPIPEIDHIITNIIHFNVLGNSLSHDTFDILEQFGWVFPSDIQGGTESDCAYTAIIAMLCIQKNGIERYLEYLNKAELFFSSPSVMIDRARSWAISGLSNIEGGRLLNTMGICPDIHIYNNNNRVSKSLIDKLFIIR